MIQAKIINRINFPELRLQEELEHIAKNIIIPDIIAGIDNGMAINGGALPHNEPQTIKRKGDSRPLIDTGTLRRSFFYRLSGKSKVIIKIENNRAKIGKYLQDGIMADGRLKQYRFFGISKDAYEAAIRYTKDKIKEYTSGSKSNKR